MFGDPKLVGKYVYQLQYQEHCGDLVQLVPGIVSRETLCRTRCVEDLPLH